MLSTPVTMKRMKLRLIADDTQLAANVLAALSVVHLEEIPDEGELLLDNPADEFQDSFHSILSRYKKIHAYIESPAQQDLTLTRATLLSVDQLDEVDEKLKRLWAEVSQHEEQQRQLKEQISAVNQLLGSLQRFINLDIDLKRLGRKSQFLNVQTGMVASTNTEQLRRALSISGYVLDRFYTFEGFDFVIIVGSAEQAQEVQELLRSADFRELSIPDEFTDHPHTVSEKLIAKQQDINQKLDLQQQQLQELVKSNQLLLQQAGEMVYQAMPYAYVAAYLKGKGRLVTLQGWVPEYRMKEVEQSLQGRLEYPYQLIFESPAQDELSRVPTKLRQNWLIKPFNSLIKQYGLPQYGEYDPSILFALSYTLMFGMMFGDIGHGGVILLGALMFIRRLPALAVIGSLAGASSIMFGFFYGSLFGYEHIVHPLWMSPMEDPQHVLRLALYWGIGFLIIANLLSIRNAWVMGLYRQALYSPLGVTGLAFYLLAVFYLITVDSLPSLAGMGIKLLILIAMLMMLYYQWLESSGSLVERVMVVMVEGLEIVINNVSATLSFLRIAAFSLNHIALATAVFTLAAMLDTFGHGVAIVLGNIFIIVLEGAIVAIQCLRLEYYEGFSRFFSGKGKPYQPLKIDPI